MVGETLTLLEIPIQRRSFLESVHAVAAASHEGAVRVFFVRADSLVLALDDKCYKRCLQLAEFCFGEGGAITLAAHLLSDLPAPATIKSSEWVPAFFEVMAPERPSLFCIGGSQSAHGTLEDVVKSRWPSIHFIGHQSSDYTPEAEKSIIDTIEKTRPAIVLLGMESPLEEQFACRHWHTIKNAGVRVVIGGGEAIDAMAEVIPMVPRLARSLHMEWLLNMVLSPGRFYSRYVRGGIRFFWHLRSRA